MQYKTKIAGLAVALLLAAPLFAAIEGASKSDALAWSDAPRLVHPEKAAIYAATQAGKRIVAVGDYGVVLLSDDGKAFRQASRLPSRAPLTSVYFIDAQHGWAAGHDGTVLATDDGGDNWRLLRQEAGKERVLLSVWFENASHGLAVGQFGLALETEDGGQTWKERRLIESGEDGERHLMQIVPAGNGLVLIAAEAGGILRSEDGGRNWKMVQTANKGSFWTGMALSDGSLVVAGMRGHVFRSEDRGLSWKEMDSGTQQSLTAMALHPDGSLAIVGASGVTLQSRDQGRSFTASQRADRTNLSAVAAGGAGDVHFSLLGPVAAAETGK